MLLILTMFCVCQANIVWACRKWVCKKSFLIFCVCQQELCWKMFPCEMGEFILTSWRRVASVPMELYTTFESLKVAEGKHSARRLTFTREGSIFPLGSFRADENNDILVNWFVQIMHVYISVLLLRAICLSRKALAPGTGVGRHHHCAHSQLVDGPGKMCAFPVLFFFFYQENPEVG